MTAHDRVVTATEVGVYVSCPSCSWSELVPDQDRADVAFRLHCADSYTRPVELTSGRDVVRGHALRPEVSPWTSLAVSCVLCLLLWAAAIRGVWEAL